MSGQHKTRIEGVLPTRICPAQFWAECSCGWMGPARPGGGFATKDAEAHVAARAPQRGDA